MKLTYTLSNAQRKELFIRGRRLVLALPAPPADVDDPADWARSVLPADLRPCVVSAEEAEVLVAPRRGGQHPPATLTELVGEVLPEVGGKWFAISVVAILVTLEHARPARGEVPGVQWPANVTIDGRPLLTGPTQREVE